MKNAKLIECPRDAMQGIRSHFIPTEVKARYINALLQVGFDTVDFGSFVSPKAIPQMRDTAAVLSQLNLDNVNSKLLAIIANKRGAMDAMSFEEITYPIKNWSFICQWDLAIPMATPGMFRSYRNG